MKLKKPCVVCAQEFISIRKDQRCCCKQCWKENYQRTQQKKKPADFPIKYHLVPGLAELLATNPRAHQARKYLKENTK